MRTPDQFGPAFAAVRQAHTHALYVIEDHFFFNHRQTRHGVYREVVEPERLVFTYVSDDPHGIRGHETLVTIDLVDRGKQTLMIFRQALFESIATSDSHRGGWSSSMDRLAAYLAQSV